MKPFLHYVTICFLISVVWSASIPVSEGNLSIRYNPAQNHFKEVPIVHQGKLIEDHKRFQMEIVKHEIEQCKERSPEGVDMVIHIYLPSTSTIKEENELQHFEHIYDANRSFTLEPMLNFVQQEKFPPITCQLSPFDVTPSQNFHHTTSPLGHTYHKRAPGRQWQSIKLRWRQASPATKTKAAIGVGLGAATIGAVATPYVPPDQAVQKRSVVSKSNSDVNQSSKVSSPHEEDESVMDFGSQGAAPMRKRNLNEFIGTAGMAGMVGGMVLTPAVSGIKGMLYNHKNNNSSKNQRQTKRRELISFEEQTGDVLLEKREPNPFIWKAIKSAFKAVPETIKFVKGTVDVVKSKPKKRDLSLIEETISFDDTTFSSSTPSLLPFRKRSLQQNDYAPALVKRLRRGGGGKKGGGFLGGLVKKVMGGLGHAGNAATVVSTAGGAAATLHAGWKGNGEAAAAAAPKKRGLPQQTRRQTMLIRRGGKLGFGNKRIQNAANARKKATTQAQLKPKGGISKPATGKPQGGKPPAGKLQGQGRGRGRGNGGGGRGRGVGAGGGQAAGGGGDGMMSKALGGLNHAGNAAMVVSTAGGAAASLSAGWKGSGEEAAAAAAPQKRALPQHQTKRQTMLIRRAGKLGFGNKHLQNAANARKKATTQAQLKPKGGISKPATGKPGANKPQGGKPPAAKPQGQGQGRGRGNGGGGRGRGRGGAGGGAAAGGGGGMSTGDKLQAGVGAAMSASMLAGAVGDVKSWVGGSGGGEQQAAPAAKRRSALMFDEMEEYDTMMLKKRFRVSNKEELEIINYEIHSQPDSDLITIDEQQNQTLQLVKRSPLGGGAVGRPRPRRNGGGGGGLGAKAGAALEVAGSASMVGGMLTPVFEPAGKAIHNMWNKISGGGKKKAA